MNNINTKEPTVKLSQKNYNLLKTYAEITNQTVEELLSSLIINFLNEHEV